MRAILTTVILASAGCATVSMIETPPAAPPVEVQLAATPDQAFDRVVAAFTAEGLTVDQADRSGGIVKSAAVQGQSAVVGGLAVVTASSVLFYRANILTREGGSTVLLNVSGRTTMTSSGRTETSEELPLTQCPPGDSAAIRNCREGYDRIQARLQEIARRIRQ
jgi:hypothetical protein